MAQYPRTQAEIINLATSILTGIESRQAIFRLRVCPAIPLLLYYKLTAEVTEKR